MINAKMKCEQPNASTAMAAVTEQPKIASKAVRKEILVNSLIESPRSGRQRMRQPASLQAAQHLDAAEAADSACAGLQTPPIS